MWLIVHLVFMLSLNWTWFWLNHKQIKATERGPLIGIALQLAGFTILWLSLSSVK
jgi:hypothetical protein